MSLRPAIRNNLPFVVKENLALSMVVPIQFVSQEIVVKENLALSMVVPIQFVSQEIHQ